MKKITIIIGSVVVLVIIGLLYRGYDIQKQAEYAANDYKSIAYTIGGQRVLLVDGIAETEAAPGSASKVTTKHFGNEARADLNGDGMEDAAFILTQSGGGSGTFYYVVAALKTSDGYQGTNGILLGDRIAPQTTQIRDGQVVVNYADRSPGEPMSTPPSVGVSKYLRIENGVLVEVAPPVASDLWKTFSSTTSSITFRYPDHLLTRFITAQDWPPAVSVASGTFSCNEGGSEVLPPGSVKKRMVDNRAYCVKLQGEGAAGSTYMTYDYTTEKDGKLVTVSFTLRLVQCANYDDPEKTACEQERGAFDLDGVIDRIAQSVQEK